MSKLTQSGTFFKISSGFYAKSQKYQESEKIILVMRLRNAQVDAKWHIFQDTARILCEKLRISRIRKNNFSRAIPKCPN